LNRNGREDNRKKEEEEEEGQEEKWKKKKKKGEKLKPYRNPSHAFFFVPIAYEYLAF
jgi:hypothetical protein